MYYKIFSPNSIFSRPARWSLAVVIIGIAWAAPALAQNFSSSDREAGRSMLTMVQLDIEKNYYDPTFHGIDLKARFKTADDRIKAAKSNGEIFGIIAQVMLDFDDSHLFFLPPPRATDVQYGWKLQMVGDKCLVVAVKPGSDAEGKGLKVGDQVLDLDGFQPNREIMWKLLYLYYSLKPRAGVRMTVASPDGAQRKLEIAANIKQKPKMVSFDFYQRPFQDAEQQDEDHLKRDRFVEVGEDLLIWKMPEFDETNSDAVDSYVARAKKHKALVIDLRDNSGGYVAMLQRLVSDLFDHDVKILDEKRRKETKEQKSKTRGSEAFKGKLVVIVNSGCASAAEIFPRVIQLEKRGIVIGERTAGAVMESQSYSHQVGLEVVVPYGTSITIADLVMSDGKSLEHVGVTPDEVILPTAADLAAGRDPVLARAAALLGVDLTPEKAGTLFPVEWAK